MSTLIKKDLSIVRLVDPSKAHTRTSSGARSPGSLSESTSGSLHVRTVKSMARLRGYTGSPEPSLFAYVIMTLFDCAGPLRFIPFNNYEHLTRPFRRQRLVESIGQIIVAATLEK